MTIEDRPLIKYESSSVYSGLVIEAYKDGRIINNHLGGDKVEFRTHSDILTSLAERIVDEEVLVEGGKNYGGPKSKSSASKTLEVNPPGSIGQSATWRQDGRLPSELQDTEIEEIISEFKDLSKGKN